MSARSLSPELSLRIEAARVLCIAGMIFVHVPPHDPGTGTALADAGAFGLIESFLRDGLGRASASLLSIISGWLTYAAIGRPGLIAKRFRSIILSMAVWGLIILAVYAAVEAFVRPTFLGRGLSESGNDALYIANVLFFLTEAPRGATIHLAFLRDIFMCAVISPLLLKGLRAAPVALFALLTLLFLLNVNSIVVLRPLILICFTIGLWLADCKLDVTALDRYLPLWAACFVAAAFGLMAWDLKLYPDWAYAARFEWGPAEFDINNSALFPLSRAAGSLFVWGVAARLTRAQWLLRLRPVIFLAYCSHMLLLTIIWFAAWKPLLGGTGSAFYPVWFLMAPALSFALASALAKALALTAPRLGALLSGGRSAGSDDLPRRLQRNIGKA